MVYWRPSKLNCGIVQIETINQRPKPEATMHRQEYVIACDPGSTAMGFAIFRRSTKKLLATIQIGIPQSIINEDMDDPNKTINHTYCMLHQLATEMDRIKLIPWHAHSLYIETPWQSTHKTSTSAHFSGSLQKLVTAYGMICYHFRHQGMWVHQVSVQQWKGQLPKDVSHERIISRIPEFRKKPVALAKQRKMKHSMDAIGIGLHGQGVKLS